MCGAQTELKGQGETGCSGRTGTHCTPDTGPWPRSLLVQLLVNRGPKHRQSARKFCLFPYLCSLSPFKQKSTAFHSSKHLAVGSCFPHPHQLPAEEVGASGCCSGVLLVKNSPWGHLVQYKLMIFNSCETFFSLLMQGRGIGESIKNTEVTSCRIVITVIMIYHVPQSSEALRTKAD